MAESRRPDMILVMGVTGSGKSYFCNSVAGREVAKEGEHLSSCTTACQAVIVSVGGTKVMLVDTPGFGDPNKSDSQILRQISTVLAAQYKLGFNLKGVIYLYRITDIRHTGGTSRAPSLFTRICGDHAFKNVILTTTRWDLISENTGAQREVELRQGFWKHMLTLDASMARYKGDRASALAIVSKVLKIAGKNAVVLELQREMVEENKALKDTAAGSFINDDLRDVRARHEQELAELEILKQQMLSSDRRRIQSTEEGIESEKQIVASAKKDQEELSRRIAEEVQAEIQEETTKSKRNRSTQWFHTVALDESGKDRIWRHRSVHADEVDIVQSDENGSPGSMQPGDPNGPRDTKGKYRRKGHQITQGVKKLMGGEGLASQRDKQMFKSEYRPEVGNAEDSGPDFTTGEEDGGPDFTTREEDAGPDFTTGEERVQPRLSFPIADHQEADQSITMRFEDLHARLKTWSTSFATEHEIEEVKPNLRQIIEALMPDARNRDELKRLVADRRSRRHLVEAVVSFVMFSRLFEGFGNEDGASSLSVDLWMSSEMASSVHFIEATLKESDRKLISLRELNEWRALSIALLSRACTSVSTKHREEDESRHLADHIMGLLDGWYPAEQLHRIHKRLASLIKACIALSRLLRQQREYWFVTYKNETTDDCLNRFDAEAMMDVDANDNEERGHEQESQANSFVIPQKVVLFKIFPGLFKRGNADGLRYDIEDCYVKIRVKVS